MTLVEEITERYKARRVRWGLDRPNIVPKPSASPPSAAQRALKTNEELVIAARAAMTERENATQRRLAEQLARHDAEQSAIEDAISKQIEARASVKIIVMVAAKLGGLLSKDIYGTSRPTLHVSTWRHAARNVARRRRPDLSLCDLARYFEAHHATVFNSLRRAKEVEVEIAAIERVLDRIGEVTR